METNMNPKSCRICFTKERMKLLCLFSVKIDEKPLADMVTFLADIQISNEDNHPQMICVQCLSNVTSACKIKRKCVEADQTLRNLSRSLPKSGVAVAEETCDGIEILNMEVVLAEDLPEDDPTFVYPEETNDSEANSKDNTRAKSKRKLSLDFNQPETAPKMCKLGSNSAVNFNCDPPTAPVCNFAPAFTHSNLSIESGISRDLSPTVEMPGDGRNGPNVCRTGTDTEPTREVINQPTNQVVNQPTEPTRTVLRNWLEANKHHPFPTKDQKMKFCRELGLKMYQIDNWFKNGRNRFLPNARRK